jgi:hypothetical protein
MRGGYRFSIVAAVLALGASGCGINGSANSPERLRDYITIRSPGSSVQMRVTADRIHGPEADIARVPEGYRGQVRNNVIIELRFEGNNIRGSRGGAPIDLRLESSGDTLVVRGLYAGRLSWLEVGPAALRGRFGDCAYDTRAAPLEGVSYKGMVSCGSGYGPVSIILPEIARTMRLDETAAMLAIALTR